jgi:hypothetical protein
VISITTDLYVLRDSIEIRKSGELPMRMGPEKRALFAPIVDLRRRIGPVDFDVVDALREMRECRDPNG